MPNGFSELAIYYCFVNLFMSFSHVSFFAVITFLHWAIDTWHPNRRFGNKESDYEFCSTTAVAREGRAPNEHLRSAWQSTWWFVLLFFDCDRQRKLGLRDMIMIQRPRSSLPFRNIPTHQDRKRQDESLSDSLLEACRIGHHEYVLQRQTEQGVLPGCLAPSCLRRIRPDMWATGNWKLHHDNAPAHAA